MKKLFEVRASKSGDAYDEWLVSVNEEQIKEWIDEVVPALIRFGMQAVSIAGSLKNNADNP